MSNKYVCPKCGGNIQYRTEYVVSAYSAVDEKTGKGKGDTYLGQLELMNTDGFVECVACSWDDDECLSNDTLATLLTESRKIAGTLVGSDVFFDEKGENNEF